MNGASMVKSATLPAPQCLSDVAVGRETQVSLEMDRQGAALERLWNALLSVESRLDSVLRGTSPDAMAEQKLREVKVALAEQLEKNNDSIADAAWRLEGILSRLEL